ncbi:MAG TPA: hypothetical protein VFA96_02265 [Nocardioides sp.]|nr:hypothetical protein [Nocardioides sp.]
MNRFPTVEAVREHLRNPTEAMFRGGREERESREAQIKAIADNPTLMLSRGGRLVCYKDEGDWRVAVPGVIRHIPVPFIDLRSKAKALLFAQILEEGIDMPWDGDDVIDAMFAFPDTHGEALPQAIMRIVAGNDKLDPKDMIAAEVAAQDASRARQERILIREAAAGYTERIQTSQIEPGDEISYSYANNLPYVWRGLGIHTDRNWASITIRGQVTDEGRLMTRHGNNYDESVDGMRFKIAYGVWFDDNGDATGSLPEYATVPTASWSARVLRKPKAAGK